MTTKGLKIASKLIEDHWILFHTLRRIFGSKIKNQLKSSSLLYRKESVRKSTGINLLHVICKLRINCICVIMKEIKGICFHFFCPDLKLSLTQGRHIECKIYHIRFRLLRLFVKFGGEVTSKRRIKVIIVLKQNKSDSVWDNAFVLKNHCVI